MLLWQMNLITLSIMNNYVDLIADSGLWFVGMIMMMRSQWLGGHVIRVRCHVIGVWGQW